MLLIDGNSLAWFELKTQAARLLVTGKEKLSDARISPDGQFVSFLRDYNLWVVDVADGKVRALTTHGSEEIRKGELDWVYPEELDITTAYWWAPDSSAIAFLKMDERQVSQFPLVISNSYRESDARALSRRWRQESRGSCVRCARVGRDAPADGHGRN